MKYEYPRESEKVSEVLSVIFNEPKRVPEIAEELEKSESTVYKRLNALKHENLVKEEEYRYTPNKNLIYEEFWNKILKDLNLDNEQIKNRFNKIKQDIRENKEFRNHILNFVEKELEHDKTTIRELHVKYKDRLEIRYNYIYLLSENSVPQNEISTEKQEFWKYLQIIQAFLPHAVWTEAWHITDLEMQMQPVELENLKETWVKLQDKAEKNLEELAKEH